jgi:hypothetical protein
MKSTTIGILALTLAATGLPNPASAGDVQFANPPTATKTTGGIVVAF